MARFSFRQKNNNDDYSIPGLPLLGGGQHRDSQTPTVPPNGFLARKQIEHQVTKTITDAVASSFTGYMVSSLQTEFVQANRLLDPQRDRFAKRSIEQLLKDRRHGICKW